MMATDRCRQFHPIPRLPGAPINRFQRLLSLQTTPINGFQGLRRSANRRINHSSGVRRSARRRGFFCKLFVFMRLDGFYEFLVRGRIARLLRQNRTMVWGFLPCRFCLALNRLLLTPAKTRRGCQPPQTGLLKQASSNRVQGVLFELRLGKAFAPYVLAGVGVASDEGTHFLNRKPSTTYDGKAWQVP